MGTDRARTRAERQDVLDQLEEARQLAAEAGVTPDVRRPKSMITFWELVGVRVAGGGHWVFLGHLLGAGGGPSGWELPLVLRRPAPSTACQAREDAPRQVAHQPKWLKLFEAVKATVGKVSEHGQPCERQWSICTYRTTGSSMAEWWAQLLQQCNGADPGDFRGRQAPSATKRERPGYLRFAAFWALHGAGTRRFWRVKTSNFRIKRRTHELVKAQCALAISKSLPPDLWKQWDEASIRTADVSKEGGSDAESHFAEQDKEAAEVSLHETAAKKKETEDLDEEEPGLSMSMLQKLLRWLNVPMTMQGKQAMEEKLSSVLLTPKNELSFVGFLQMMRWMLDTNFCGINGVAQKAASAVQQQQMARQQS
eukprot:Skav200524  [mRNA]  locus=scaffold450:616055:622084:- [translate_table: standard]